MREKKYQQKRALHSRDEEIYRLHVIEGVKISGIMEKMQISRSTVFRSLSIFEHETPQLAEQMKKQGKNVTPEDYKELLKEISELKKNLAQERLRADFYEEMVAFGKEVYGIDLKRWHQVAGRLHNRDKKQYGIVPMCRLLGVSKQAYYKHVDKQIQKLAAESFVVEYVKEIRAKDPGIGGNKLWLMYRIRFGEEYSVGYNRFYDILDRFSLKVRKRRCRVRTTDSNHDRSVYPNLVKDLIPERTCQLMVSDITYIPLEINPETGKNTFCYMSVVTDAYSKEIIGYSIGKTLDTRYPLEALEMAVNHYRGKELSALIHHSDRGVQYASYAYTARLKDYKISISMTESGNPKENAIAERINNTIKNELLKDMKFSRISEVKAAVKSAVDFYNHERPHWSLDGLTPSQAAGCKGELKKRWISYREKAIKNQNKIGMTG